MKEVLDVLSGLQIMALREASLVPSYVGKTQLVLTNETVTELFNLSTQLQFCLNLNRCAIHTLWNNGDLIKQTQRMQVKGIANLQWAASDLSNPQSLTHAAAAHGPIKLCGFGPAVLLGCTPLSCGITAHYPGYFHSCWFDQVLSWCIMRFCSRIFSNNRKRSMH